jgi:hypothetical protein
MKALILPLLTSLVLVLPASTQDGGCEVISTQTDYQPPPSPVDAPLVIAVSFNANVSTAQRAVILQATSEWTALIETAGHIANPYFMTFVNGPLSGSTLARANTTWNSSTGYLTGSTVTIDNDGSSNFYIDPTPGGNGEFDGNGNCTDPSCMNLTDLLTVMRHEVGHAMGWTGAYGSPTNPLTTAYISGTTFDGARLNIAMDPALTSHCNASVHPNDLMTPTIPQELRRPIQMYPAAAFIARNIDHWLTLKFVDGSYTGFPVGTADLPWNTLLAVSQVASPGDPILLIPGTIDEPGVTVITDAHQFFLARGGTAVAK